MGSQRNNSAYLMLDVGGTFTKSGVINWRGEIFPGSQFTADMPSDRSKEEIAGSLERDLRRGIGFIEAKGLKTAAVGIAIPGPFDYAAGVSLMQHKFRSLYGESVRELVYDVSGMDRRIPVIFLHDVNAALMGELLAGNGAGHRNIAIITLGTGLGFSSSRDGRVRCSPLGSPATPIYNIPYRDGILEDWVSKRGILRIYGDIAGGIPEGFTVADIGRMADGGDRAALSAFAAAGRILASSVEDILMKEETECLLLGGQISRSFVHMEESLRGGLAGLPSLVRIAPVRNMDEAAFFGLLKHINDGDGTIRNTPGYERVNQPSKLL